MMPLASFRVTLGSLWLPFGYPCSLWGALGSLWLPLGCLGLPLAPFGCPWTPFGSLWGALGLSLAPFRAGLAPFGVPLGFLWGALGSLWVPLDSLWVPLGCPLAPFGLQGGQKRSSTVKINKNAFFGTRHGSHRNRRNPAKWCQELCLGAHLPHAPGARMTVVTQTPSN